MSNYENAPATHMLASHCCICSRPLLDAASVEAGMGPHCRKKHGYYAEVSEESRAQANKIIHSIAYGLDGFNLLKAFQTLRDLGFDLLVQALIKARATVQIEVLGDTLVVHASYKEAALGAWRNIEGRQFNYAKKVNLIPNIPQARVALWTLLKQYYGGELMQSSKGGLSIIPA